MKNILLAIDNIEGSTPSSPVIERTVELAAAFSSKVWLVHVVPQPGLTPFNVPREMLREQAAGELCHEHKHIHRLADRLRERDIDATALLIEGATVHTLLAEAERLNVDLIVAGFHGHGVLYRTLLDGTGEQLLRKSSYPIMFVPQS